MKLLAIIVTLIVAILAIIFIAGPTATDCGPNTRVPSDVKQLVTAIQVFKHDHIQNKRHAYPASLEDLTKEGYLSESDLKSIRSKETRFSYFPPPSDDVPPVYPLIAAQNQKFVIYGFVSGEIRREETVSKAEQDAAANP